MNRVSMLTRFYLSLWFLVKAVFVFFIPAHVLKSTSDQLHELGFKGGGK